VKKLVAALLLVLPGLARADYWNFVEDRVKYANGTLSASQYQDDVSGTKKVKLSAAEPGATVGVQATVISVSNNQPSGTSFVKSVYTVGDTGCTNFTGSTTIAAVVIPSTATSLTVGILGSATNYLRCYVRFSGGLAAAACSLPIYRDSPLVLPMIKTAATGATVYLIEHEGQGNVFGGVCYGIAPTNF
jgi:hypothetical protein